MLAPVRMSIEQMKEAAGLGAFIEFVYNALIGSNKSFTIEEYARALRAVGPDHCILSSDLGQAGNPLHTEGLQEYFRLLAAQGFSRADLERMSRKNPATFLGLP